MASKTMLVAQREYLENVRTKTFWISIFIVPVLIAASMGIGVLLNKFKEVQTYAVVDLGDEGLADDAERAFRKNDMLAVMELMASYSKEDGKKALKSAAKLKDMFEGFKPGDTPTGEQQLAIMNWMANQPPEALAKIEGISASKNYDFVSLEELELDGKSTDEQQEALNKLVKNEKLFAYFVLGKNPVEDLADFRYVSNNLTDDKLRNSYQNTLTKLVQDKRIKAADIDAKTAESIQERVRFKKEKVSDDGKAEDVEDEDTINQWAPMGFVYFLFVSIFGIANLLLTNTVEEKSNRIIEVLLSSVSPSQLMNGKIFGIAFTGLTIVGTWVIFALIASWVAPSLLGDSGGLLSALIAAISNTKYLLAFVLYFIGGFLLYAAVLVAIGSVCNTLKEAQNLMQPVMMVLMIPLIAMMFITREPNGTVAKFMSFIPLFTPFTMMNRASGPPETWEYIATSVLLIVTIWFAFKAAGKVFRVGILMTGNPPKLKEIFSWLRQS